MKLIIIGSTGLLATELIKRAIVDTDIESIVAIARRQTVFPPIPSGKVIKLKSVICENFDNWEEIGKSIDDADACIWYVIVFWVTIFHCRFIVYPIEHAGTFACVMILIDNHRNIAPSPAQFQGLDFEESRKICTNNILAGMRCIMKLQEKDIEDEWIDEPRPVRFIYVSCARERDEQVLPAQYHISLLRVSSSISPIPLPPDRNAKHALIELNRAFCCYIREGIRWAFGNVCR